MSSKSVCLNMIVKDESKIICRCLSSVKKLIDYWVIVDTGSSDGTQDVISEYISDIPGELHERKWVNFEHNRNEALDLARNKSDYILFMDADDMIEYSNSFDKSALDKDCYFMLCRDPVVDSYRLKLINNHSGWKWTGILHEDLTNSQPVNGQVLSGIEMNGLSRDGRRAQDPKRYLKDALILEKIHREHPKDSRTVFYLAQSYLKANETFLALKYNELRASMGGYEDEIFWSLYTVACLREDLNCGSEEIINSYLKAFQFNGSRAEPLYKLSRYLIKIGKYSMGCEMAKKAVSIPFPKTLFFVQRDVYEYESLLFLSYSQHLLKLFDEATSSYQQLLAKKNLPESERKTVEQFLQLSQRKQCIKVVGSCQTIN